MKAVKARSNRASAVGLERSRACASSTQRARRDGLSWASVSVKIGIGGMGCLDEIRIAEIQESNRPSAVAAWIPAACVSLDVARD